MAGGTFSILRSVRGYHIYKEICSYGKFRANKFSRLKLREFEPFAKIAIISPSEIFPLMVLIGFRLLNMVNAN